MTALGGRMFGTYRGIAGIVYGTIAAMSVIVADSKQGESSAGDLAAVTMTTAVVLWLAHVYATAIGDSLHHGRPLTMSAVRDVAVHQGAIVLAAVAPVAMLVLGAVGALKDSTAVWAALGIGMVTLAVQGVRYARAERLGRRAAVFAVSLNLLLGLALVGLKAAFIH